MVTPGLVEEKFESRFHHPQTCSNQLNITFSTTDNQSIVTENRIYSSRSAERSEFIISSRAQWVNRVLLLVSLKLAALIFSCLYPMVSVSFARSCDLRISSCILLVSDQSPWFSLHPGAPHLPRIWPCLLEKLEKITHGAAACRNMANENSPHYPKHVSCCLSLTFHRKNDLHIEGREAT